MSIYLDASVLLALMGAKDGSVAIEFVNAATAPLESDDFSLTRSFRAQSRNPERAAGGMFLDCARNERKKRWVTSPSSRSSRERLRQR